MLGVSQRRMSRLSASVERKGWPGSCWMDAAFQEADLLVGRKPAKAASPQLVKKSVKALTSCLQAAEKALASVSAGPAGDALS